MPIYQDRMKQLYHRIYPTVTEAEHQLWRKLRGKQVLGVQFYRHKPLGDHLMDFFAYKVELGIELNGGQGDRSRVYGAAEAQDVLSAAQRVEVLRFDNLQVLTEMDAVLREIHTAVQERLDSRYFCS